MLTFIECLPLLSFSAAVTCGHETSCSSVFEDDLVVLQGLSGFWPETGPASLVSLILRLLHS
jgi:hypothetical protein